MTRTKGTRPQPAPPSSSVTPSSVTPLSDEARPVPADLHDVRVDRAVVVLFDLSMAAAKRLCAAGRVVVDGKRAAAGDRVVADARIALRGGGGWLVPVDDARVAVLVTQRDLVVVDKPSGMPIHPMLPGEGGTLADVVAARFPETADASPDAREGGLVHRLDTGTSGCVLLARSRASWTQLRDALEHADKQYVALVAGVIDAPRSVDAPVAHDASDRRRMCIDASGRDARTDVVPLQAAANGSCSLVRLTLHGGRRHQLRVHLASIGHPLVGDALYGGPETSPALFWLHASRVALPDGRTFEAPLPPAFVDAARARGLAP